jgi:hypothetical protein
MGQPMQVLACGLACQQADQRRYLGVDIGCAIRTVRGLGPRGGLLRWCLVIHVPAFWIDHPSERVRAAGCIDARAALELPAEDTSGRRCGRGEN